MIINTHTSTSITIVISYIKVFLNFRTVDKMWTNRFPDPNDLDSKTAYLLPAVCTRNPWFEQHQMVLDLS